jgi:hypothetical protein
LTAPATKEKIWTTRSAKFGGEDSDKRAIVVCALHGHRGSGAAFQNHLAKLMTDLGFEPCKAHPDVWLQRASKPDGSHSCKHVLFHVNDALAVCFLDPKTVLLKMDEHFPMKPDSIAVPNVCLGAKILRRNFQMDQKLGQ